MNVLLVGNHTCGNRGDAAILRGLIHGLREQCPEIELKMITRFPTSSEYLLSEVFLKDSLNHFYSTFTGRFAKVKRKYYSFIIPRILHFNVKRQSQILLPKHIRQHLKFLISFDAVVQVGGSFFVDLYGVAQFEHALCGLIANKPVYMLGHSIGPFENNYFRKVAKTVFEKVDDVSLREEVSLKIAKDSEVYTNKMTKGADTAWIVPTVQPYNDYAQNKPLIAITMRELKPFDKRLGIKQTDYEIAFAELAQKFINDGYDIIALSTCTGIDSYKKDDRMVALRVQKLVNNINSFNVLMDEINDVELGGILSSCEMTVGTRLHSAIISKNFGTPAIALNYEHKSEGIMNQLGLNEFSMPVKSLFDGSLYQRATSILKGKLLSSEELDIHVEKERVKVREMIARCISSIKEYIQ